MKLAASTVHRALSGHPNVQEETRHRVPPDSSHDFRNPICSLFFGERSSSSGTENSVSSDEIFKPLRGETFGFREFSPLSGQLPGISALSCNAEHADRRNAQFQISFLIFIFSFPGKILIRIFYLFRKTEHTDSHSGETLQESHAALTDFRRNFFPRTIRHQFFQTVKIGNPFSFEIRLNGIQSQIQD